MPECRKRFRFRAASRCRAEGLRCVCSDPCWSLHSLRKARRCSPKMVPQDGCAMLRFKTQASTFLPDAVVPLDHSPVIWSAAREASRALEQMLGHPVIVGDAFSTMPEFVIGTVTEMEARFPQWRPAERLRPGGYVIAQVHERGRTDWIIAGAERAARCMEPSICLKKSRKRRLRLRSRFSARLRNRFDG